ncbi:MAG TPA: murein biosynthesis integral membrane protein MurJ [Beijerinckiaceae bacterium]|nr:murein biosynthesis integral membrane protein MurJ [Beijerinckiaceae bacterium]
MSLVRSYTLVGSATLASRLTGFVRDILIAAVLGSGRVADAYLAAFLLPNLFRRVLSEGAFNAAFVPILSRRRTEGDASARDFVRAAFAAILALAFGLVLVAELSMPGIIKVIAPGFVADPEKFAQAVLFGRIAFGFVGAVIVSAFLASLLNAVGRYALVAMAPLILNGLLIPVLLALFVLGWQGDVRVGWVLVFSVLAAGFLQLAYVAYGVRRAGIVIWPLRWEADRDVRLMIAMVLPAVVLAGAGHFNMVVAAQLSSALPSAVSWIYYADRIFQLPLGFVAAAIGVVLLPEVSRAIRDGDHPRADDASNRALEFGMLLVLPAMLALVILARPIIDIIYRHGAFTASDSAAVADMLSALALGLPGFVLVKVFLPAFLARESLRLPLLAALAGVVANIAFTLALVGRLGPVAAPLGVATSAWVNALLLGIGLKMRGVFRLDGRATRSLPLIVVAAALTGAVTYANLVLFEPWLAPDRALALRTGALALVCLSGVGVHAVASHLFGIADLGGLRRAFGRTGA